MITTTYVLRTIKPEPIAIFCKEHIVNIYSDYESIAEILKVSQLLIDNNLPNFCVGQFTQCYIYKKQGQKTAQQKKNADHQPIKHSSLTLIHYYQNQITKHYKQVE